MSVQDRNRETFHKINKMGLEVALGGEKLILRAGIHAGGSPALWLEDDLGAPYAPLTVHLDELHLPEGHFLLRNREVPEGTAEALQATGLFEPCGSTVSSGYVEDYAQLWRLKKGDDK